MCGQSDHELARFITSKVAQWLVCWAHNPKVRGSKPRSAIHIWASMQSYRKMDTLGIEPRASQMLSGCDTTTPRALWKDSNCNRFKENGFEAEGTYGLALHICHACRSIKIGFDAPSHDKPCTLHYITYQRKALQLRLTGVWRNSSTSDSRSEGWEFESLCAHFCHGANQRSAK